jgi:DNA-binding transcriptional MocR family regulator
MMNTSVRYTPRGATASAIAADVERAVRQGKIGPGDPLLPVRVLADRNRVSATTVAGAYRELARRGLTRGDGRRGTRIRSRPPLPAPVGLPPPAGLRDLATGNPDPALLPDLGEAIRRVSPAHRRPARLYGEAPELAGLVAWGRDQLAADGIPVADATDIAVVSGALDGVERVLEAHIRPGDPVLVEDPGYPPAFDLLAARGAEPVPVPVDDRGLVPAQVDAALTAAGPVAVLCTPRAQNPTGAAFDRGRAAELRRVLARHPDVLVIEDDHAGAVAGTAALTLATRRRRRWAVVRSVAKSLGPDLRLAILAGDPETVARVRGRQQLGPGWVSHLLQELALSLATGAGADARFNRAARTYTRRRRALLAALDRLGIAAPGRSGLNVWVPVPDEHAAVAAMADAGYAVAPGTRFRMRTPPAVRITTATLQPEEAPTLAAALAAAIQPTGRRIG